MGKNETHDKDRIGKVEPYGVGHIPEDERKSSPKNLSSILFGGSMTFGIIIIGWFPVSFGLGWWASASAIVAGSALGAAFLAGMGLMGPRTGTTNPVSSGAYFGVAGRLIGSFLEGSASLAFAALSIWTGGDALAGALSRYAGMEDAGTARLVCYAVLAILVTTVSILGHATMVAAQKLMVPTAGLCMLVGLWVYGQGFDADYAGVGVFAYGSFWPTWIVSALLCAATVSSYGAYAGDWTRHISRKLHADKSILRALFIGGLFGMGGPFMWGAFTASAVFSSGAADASTPYVMGLIADAPLWFIPALMYLGLASGTTQAVINTYGTGLDTSAIIPRLNRVQATVLACVLATLLVYVGHFYDTIAAALGVYLQMLVCFSIPWIIIIVMGHIRRRGYYNVDDLQVFNRGEKGGIYWFRGGINYKTLTVWSLAVVAGLLASHNDWFTGPLVPYIGGIDGGLLASALVAFVAYSLALRFFPDSPEVSGLNTQTQPTEDSPALIVK
jgi:purine-cytosine permease-like protein